MTADLPKVTYLHLNILKGSAVGETTLHVQQLKPKAMGLWSEVALNSELLIEDRKGMCNVAMRCLPFFCVLDFSRMLIPSNPVWCHFCLSQVVRTYI